MKSRARMLLEKEFVKLQSETLWGVIAEPLNDDNFFVWEAKIQGLKDTMWEGGIFKLYFKFNEMYNCAPPQIVFTTIPFHPNVDISNGKPCVDFLDNIHDWRQNYSVGYILLSLQTLLANPVLENAVNNEAASVYVDNPKVYRQIVLNCVLASKRLDADIPPEARRENADTPAQSTAEKRSQKSHQGLPRTNKVSFEDYLSLWKGIATSNASDTTSNPLTEFLKTDNKLQNAHFELSKDELEQEIRTQLAEHNRLMYGTFTKEGRGQYDIVDQKADRINLLKQVCSPKQNTHATTPVHLAPLMDDTPDLDKEVDDLVNWTRSLSPEQVNF